MGDIFGRALQTLFLRVPDYYLLQRAPHAAILMLQARLRDYRHSHSIYTPLHANEAIERRAMRAAPPCVEAEERRLTFYGNAHISRPLRAFRHYYEFIGRLPLIARAGQPPRVLYGLAYAFRALRPIAAVADIIHGRISTAGRRC